jgi:hypothetical protein
MPLDAGARERLRQHAGAAADRLRVHRGEPADRLARAHGAAAVTVGEEIYFGHGQFRPHEPAGFALLVHEALHVTEAMRPNAAWRRATAAGAAEEEHEATARERAAFVQADAGPPVRRSPGPAHRPAEPPVHAARPAPGPAGTPVAASTPAQRPMAAPLRREPAQPVQPVQPGQPAQTAADPLAPHPDLRHQLRIEWERGG